MSQDIEIKQGKTFTRVFRWGSEPVVFKAITAVTATAPATFTVTGHGLPASWAAAIESVEGMIEVNANHNPPHAEDFRIVETVDVNTVKFPGFNVTDFNTYVSGGFIRYYTPVDLAGYTARMKIKNRPGGTEYASLVSPTNIAIDNTAKTITVTITATATALYTFSYAVYDLELESAGGVITEIAAGQVALIKEVTV